MWKSGKLEIGWGFAAMVLLALLAGAGGVLPLVLLSALCHELGHLAALRLAGTEVELLRLTAFGAEIRADTRYLPYPKEILCTLAGPAVNLVLALVFARIAGDYVLAGANLLLGVFNLLPVPSLDGGRALFLLVSWGADPGTADQLCRRVGLGCALGLTALALALTLWHGAGLFLLLGALGTLLPQLPRRRRGRDGRSFSKKKLLRVLKHGSLFSKTEKRDRSIQNTLKQRNASFFCSRISSISLTKSLPAMNNGGQRGKNRAINWGTETQAPGKRRGGKRNMVLDRIALILVIIGALNWGIIGLFGLDMVAFFCGGQAAVLSRIIYSVVGLAGLWCVSLLFRERAPEQAAA